MEQHRDPFRHGDYEPRRMSVISQGVEMGDVVRYADGTWRCVNSMARGREFGFRSGGGPVRAPRWTLAGAEGRIEVVRFPDNVEPWATTMQTLREGVWILDGAAGGRVGRVSGPPVETAEGHCVDVQGASGQFELQSPDSDGYLFAFRVLPG